MVNQPLKLIVDCDIDARNNSPSALETNALILLDCMKNASFKEFTITYAFLHTLGRYLFCYIANLLGPSIKIKSSFCQTNIKINSCEHKNYPDGRYIVNTSKNQIQSDKENAKRLILACSQTFAKKNQRKTLSAAEYSQVYQVPRSFV